MLLLLAALSLFLLQTRSAGFRADHRGFLSAHGLALGGSLFQGGPPLFMYAARELKEGKLLYEAYNRFPALPFYLIGAASRSFAPDLAREVLAARQLMNAFFCLVLAMLYILLGRLGLRPWMAAAGALVVGSNYYLATYGDMVFNDTPALCGFLCALWLALRGPQAESGGGEPPASSATPGSGTRGSIRRRWRWTRTLLPAIPVFLGWQALAVYAAWFLVGLVPPAAAARSSGRSAWQRRLGGARLLRPAGRALVIGGSAALLILIAQIGAEWSVVRGPVTDLPSVRSLTWRIGAGPSELYAEHRSALRWDAFLLGQARSLIISIAPWGALFHLKPARQPLLLIGLLLLTTAACVLSARRLARRGIDPRVSCLCVLSGFLWTLPMRHFVAFHDFQGMYYIGIPLLLAAAAGALPGRRPSAATAILAAALFVLNVQAANRHKERSEAPAAATTAEFQQIRTRSPEGSAIFFDGDRHALGIGHHAVDFYLSGRTFASRPEADFAVSPDSSFSGERLTANPRWNLYRLH